MFGKPLLDEDEYRSYELKSDETKVSARSLMKGAGLTDDQIYRPFIGVCNSYSNFLRYLPSVAVLVLIFPAVLNRNTNPTITAAMIAPVRMA